MKLYPGVVLISRNLDENLNTTPGYWNHLALVASDKEIIESQVEKGVIITPFTEYQNRKYLFIAAYPIDSSIGQTAVAIAKEMVGKNYGKFSSFRPRLSTDFIRYNCTSIVEIPYSKALKRRLRLNLPDHIFRYPEIFSIDLSENHV